MIDNVSQPTLDVIEAIRKQIPVKFTYEDRTRIINPISFYGDFYGFEGTYAEDKTKHKKFSFDKINDWQGLVL